MIGILKKIFGSRTRSDDADEQTIIEDDKSTEGPYMVAAAFYLAVILLIGVPVWFYTCSVTRYSTPDLKDLESAIVHSPLSLHLDISIVQLAEVNSAKADLKDDDDSLSKYLRSHLPGILRTSIENITYNIDWRVRRPTYEESSTFKTHLTRDATSKSSQNGKPLADLEAKLQDIHKNSSKFRLFMYLVREEDHPAFCDPTRVHSYTINAERFIYLCPSSAMSKPDDHSPVVSLIVEALEEIYSGTVDQSRAKLILDSQVDLLFTLVPETMDEESFTHLTDLADKIHHIFERNVRQKHPELKSLVNIKPITQNYIDLLDGNTLATLMATTPVKLNANQTDNQSTELREILVDRLPQLFRTFESRLSVHSAKNVHNVMLLVPKTGSPKIIMNSRPGKSINSLNYLEGEDNRSLLIVNDDKSLVLGLRAIVRRLVGLSSPNICRSCLVRRDVFFCSWEIDAIMGAMTHLKLQRTYLSLKAIDQQVMGIKIPKEVAVSVRNSYSSALQSSEHLRTRRTHEAYTLASKAYELSEAAFYDPSLIESLYFPDDLKYAIYMPFFLPLAYPIALSLVKLLKYAFSNTIGHGKQQKVKIQ